uniref:Uncharacterized protein n=1 Tax=Arundo donax TaxID=35708 RepID=A0A0A9HMS0_ARUDO
MLHKRIKDQYDQAVVITPAVDFKSCRHLQVDVSVMLGCASVA